MKAILIGNGEIGKAIYTVFGKTHQIKIHDPWENLRNQVPAGEEADVLLVTIPYSDKFVKIIKDYQNSFKSIKATIVFSTTAIGTCSQLGAVHSPVEGRHPNLAKSIVIGKRWIGGYSAYAINFFKQGGFEISDMKVMPKPEYTEFLKLRSTSLYGLNIEFARYSKETADSLGMYFNSIKEFDEDYNYLYKHLKLPQFQRYILEPPEGNIGGHCVVPNAKILDKAYPSDFLKEIYKDKNKDKYGNKKHKKYFNGLSIAMGRLFKK